ncbi:hypothetical protein Q5P01_016667 [Channa striata]|uniref:Uncharacterized protein n=1 Tax=Channa striata TaxID=64152 RepID=A0AA88SI63_CHASR|nr:hypothetical protein Q5P01_016667 [Channa striata]
MCRRERATTTGRCSCSGSHAEPGELRFVPLGTLGKRGGKKEPGPTDITTNPEEVKNLWLPKKKERERDSEREKREREMRCECRSGNACVYEEQRA